MDDFEAHDRADGSRIYKPRGPIWIPTSLTFNTDYNISELRDVYINGVRFVRAREFVEDCEVCD